MHYFVGFIGFYLCVIGTWRLATATREKPGANHLAAAEEDKHYNPIKDIYAIKQVTCWVVRVVKSHKSEGGLTDSAILHKQFNWGLLWLISGITIQYLAGFL